MERMRKKMCNPIHEQMIFPWKLKISNIQKWRRKKVKFKIIALVKTNYLLEKRKNIERICLKLKHFTNIILRFVRKAWQKKHAATERNTVCRSVHGMLMLIFLYLFICLFCCYRQISRRGRKASRSERMDRYHMMTGKGGDQNHVFFKH